MNYEKVLAQQEEFYKRIYKSSFNIDFLNYHKCFWIQIEKYLFQNNENLGELGKKIKKFIEYVDLNHPDLENFYNKNFINKENDFGKIILDYLKLCCLIVSNTNSNYILNNFKNFFYKDSNYQNLEKIIDSPLNNQLNVRLLKNKQDRELIRSTKKRQNVSIDKHSWNDLPEDFSDYARYQDFYHKNIEEALKVRKNFLDHGLKFMADEIDKNIEEIQKEIDKNNNFGFNKISIVFAAKLAAKMSGFLLNDSQEISIKLPDKLQNLSTDIFTIDSKIYTIQELKNIPNNIIKVLDYLECFPDTNYKPVFDYFRVVIPCVKLPQDSISSYSGYNYKDIDGNDSQLFDINEYQKLINLDLIHSKKILGILLGERDGEHFFINYFI